MDTFRINSTFDKSSFIRSHLILWEIHSRRRRRQVKIFLISSLILLFIGIVGKIMSGTTNSLILLGVIYLVFTLLLFSGIIASKRKIFRKINEDAENFDSAKMNYGYEFSDESVKYWDNEKKIELKWSVFTNYSIYKNYLILIIKDSFPIAYIYEKEEGNCNEYNTLLEIVEAKLEYKEIG